MKKKLLSILMTLPFVAAAQVSNPESMAVPLSRLAWTALASSAQETGEAAPSGPAAAAIDGDATTFWSSTWGTPHAHTYSIDMGALQNADMIYIVQRTSAFNNIKDMRLYISTDTVNVGWTAIGSVHTLVPTTTNAGKQYISLGGTQAFRFFKIETIINWGLYNYQNGLTPAYNDATTTIAEVGATMSLVSDNTAYSRSGWVGSACTEELAGEGPLSGRFTAVIDNDPATFWHSNWSATTPDYVYPHTLTFDMGVAQAVNVISYVQRNTGNSSAFKGKIRFSPDGTDWSLPAVWDWNNNVADTFIRSSNAVINRIVLSGVQNHRYFRIEIDSNSYAHRFPANALTNAGSFYPTAMAEIRAHFQQGALPAKITSFKAQLNRQVVFLNWQTASEQNSAYFDITRSVDGVNFVSIARVNASGNSTDLRAYSATDILPKTGVNYYQLKQVDIDGKSFLSEIVLIKNGEVAKGLAVSNIHASSTQSVKMQVASGKSANATLNIYNAAGHVLATKNVNLLSGINTVVIPFSAASGVYVISVRTAHETLSTKFIK